MNRSMDRFTASAAELGVTVEVRRFPEGTKTAQDAARAIGCDVDQIVKSLVFVADGELFLALTAGSNRADQSKLASLMGAEKVRRANAEEALEATGYSIGGTPPFGHPRQLRVFIDRDLLQHDEVWAGAGTPDSVFPLTPDELIRAAHAEPADFREE